MRTVLAGLATAVLTGGALAQAPTGTGAGHHECNTNREVREVVVRLRDMGWAAQRTIDEVLATSRVDDTETKDWFVGLVTDIYGNQTTLDQVIADHAACIKSVPAGPVPVLSALAPRMRS